MWEVSVLRTAISDDTSSWTGTWKIKFSGNTDSYHRSSVAAAYAQFPEPLRSDLFGEVETLLAREAEWVHEDGELPTAIRVQQGRAATVINADQAGQELRSRQGAHDLTIDRCVVVAGAGSVNCPIAPVSLPADDCKTSMRATTDIRSAENAVDDLMGQAIRAVNSISLPEAQQDALEAELRPKYMVATEPSTVDLPTIQVREVSFLDRARCVLPWVVGLIAIAVLTRLVAAWFLGRWNPLPHPFYAIQRLKRRPDEDPVPLGDLDIKSHQLQGNRERSAQLEIGNSDPDVELTAQFLPVLIGQPPNIITRAQCRHVLGQNGFWRKGNQLLGNIGPSIRNSVIVIDNPYVLSNDPDADDPDNTDSNGPDDGGDAASATANLNPKPSRGDSGEELLLVTFEVDPNDPSNPDTNDDGIQNALDRILPQLLPWDTARDNLNKLDTNRIKSKPSANQSGSNNANSGARTNDDDYSDDSDSNDSDPTALDSNASDLDDLDDVDDIDDFDDDDDDF